MKFKTSLVSLLLVFTMNAQIKKGSIDTEVLMQVITEKQKQIEKNILSDIAYNSTKHALFVNNATYNTFNSCLTTLLHSTNKQIITKDIVRELAIYATANSIVEKYFPYNAPEINYKTSYLSSDGTNKTSTLIKKMGHGKNSLNNEKYEQTEFYTGLRQNKEEVIKKVIHRSYLLDSIYFALYSGLHQSTTGDLKPPKKRVFNILPFDSEDGYTSSAEEKSKLIAVAKIIDGMVQNSTTPAELFDVFKYKKLEAISAENMNVLKEELLNLLQLIESRTKGSGDMANFIRIAKIIINSIDVMVDADNTEANSRFVYKNFQIDNESILLSLEGAFYNNRTVMKKTICGIGIKPDFSIGFDYLVFSHQKQQLDFTTQVLQNTNVNYVGLASEKIGLKFMFFDRKYTHSFAPGEWFQYKGKGSYRCWTQPVKKNVMFTHLYAHVYFSGLLYKLTQLNTNKQFDYSFVSTGIGTTLYDAIDINLSVGWALLKARQPFDPNYLFYKLSFDIPIFEYIKAIKK